MLAVVEQVAERGPVDPARLLAAPEPDLHPEPVAAVGERGEQLGVLLAAPQQVVVRDDPFGGAGRAPVAVEAGADERFVGQVVAREHGGDPLEERGFGQRAGRGQQAEHGPFDAICEGRGGRIAVRAIAEPPAAGLDLDQAVLRRPRQLSVDQRDEPFDGVGRLVTRRPGDPVRDRRRPRGLVR